MNKITFDKLFKILLLAILAFLSISIYILANSIENKSRYLIDVQGQRVIDTHTGTVRDLNEWRP